VLALVAGRRASARDERPSEAAVTPPGARELRLYGRASLTGAPGRSPGAPWIVRRCELRETPDGPDVGDFVATALAAEPSFGAAGRAAAPLEMHTFRVGDSSLFGIGAGGARGDRAYALIGGTGRFGGARGTVLEREVQSGSSRPLVEFVVTLVG
jgi:hypothetical protein